MDKPEKEATQDQSFYSDQEISRFERVLLQFAREDYKLEVVKPPEQTEM
jgi:hypothetical protein